AEVALSLGVSYLDVAARISGTAVTSGGGAPLEIAERGHVSGPVPLVGLHGAFWVYDRLRVRLDGRYVDVGSLFDKEKWSGSMSELGLSVDYFVLPWLGLGGGWSRTSIDADFDDGDDLGSI